MKSLLKKILPTNLIWYLVSKKEDLRLMKIKVIKSNRLFVAFNLALDYKYYREHKAFLEGAYLYEQSIKNNTVNVAYLRRNIHRIEKGMLMIPKRDVFALRFILPTVNSFKSLINSNLLNSSELPWANDVLCEYFKSVKSNHKYYIEALSIFETVKLKDVSNLGSKIPHIIEKKEILPFDEFSDLNKYRKSVRWFKDKKVSKVLVEKALEVASMTPSSCNRSPYRYFVSCENLELTRQIAEIPAGTVGWSHNVQGIAVLVGKQSSFTDVANRHSIYVDGCLSVMPFILALETLGLSTCLINWADIPSREDRMNKILSLESDEKVILSIAFGYSNEEEKVAFSQRKYINEISNFIN
jgi:nitroreductase